LVAAAGGEAGGADAEGVGVAGGTEMAGVAEDAGVGDAAEEEGEEVVGTEGKDGARRQAGTTLRQGRNGNVPWSPTVAQMSEYAARVRPQLLRP
jgi:hypothetical protein